MSYKSLNALYHLVVHIAILSRIKQVKRNNAHFFDGQLSSRKMIFFQFLFILKEQGDGNRD